MVNPTFHNKHNEQVKTEDGRTIWLGRSCAVVSEVLYGHPSSPDPLVLIIKRGPASMGSVGLWCFPCGYIDWNENSIDGAIRETWEEAGVNLNESGMLYDNPLLPSPWFVDSSPEHHRQNISIHHHFQIHKDKLPTTSMLNCESGEVDDVKWVPAYDIFRGKYQMAFGHEKNLLTLIKIIRKAEKVRFLLEKEEKSK